MSDKIEARTPLPQPNVPPTPPGPLRRLGRAFGGKNAMARGVLLVGCLLVFTLLYALMLQWLSSSDGDTSPAARTREPVAAAQPQAVAAAPARPAAAARATAVAYRAIDDADAGGPNGLTYSGSWQHVDHIFDGRSAGTSARAYRIGSSASFTFTGRRLRVYGVRGPSGGNAELRIDGETYALLRFYAPRKAAGALIYTSPPLPAGVHPVAIVVAEPTQDFPKRRYVNLDGVSYAP